MTNLAPDCTKPPTLSTLSKGSYERLNGKMHTVRFHVDDSMSSRVDAKGNDNIVYLITYDGSTQLTKERRFRIKKETKTRSYVVKVLNVYKKQWLLHICSKTGSLKFN